MLTADGTVPGQWTTGCNSGTTAPGTGGSGARLARYHTFTLDAQSDVTVSVESQDADTYLYLRSGMERSGAFLHENDDDGGITKSTIQANGLAAGTYTVEATTYDAGETGSFTLTVSGLGGGGTGPGPGTDACTETITADGTSSGTWAAGCESEARSGSYARYYQFTLDAQSDVTITLESSAVDTYLIVREGEAKSGTALHENDDYQGSTAKSQVEETLAAGTYTVEATTYDAGETGSFTLTVAGLGGGTDPGPGTDACVDTITADGTSNGTWAAGCDSQARSGSHARYYQFKLSQSSNVTITLESQAVDTYLIVRQGEVKSGTALHENDDYQGSTSKSQIQETLAAGTYTIEATTYHAAQTGDFTLTVGGLGSSGGGTPPPGGDACTETITGDGTSSGTWAAGCDSEARSGSHARYYQFTLSQQSSVTITLESSEADTYLIVRSGEVKSGTALHENDDYQGSTAKSQVEETLAAGTYTIEATTYDAGETGSFTLTVSGLGGGTDPGPGTDACAATELTADGTSSGTWAAGCESEARSGSYARYYQFTLDAQSDVTITLESSAVDTYLIVREGESKSGTALHENDDYQGSTAKSQVQETLAAGTYTIEATTYYAEKTGSFTLTVSGLGGGGGGTPPPGGDTCVETISADATISGTWASGCDSEAREDSHARYYQFTLNAQSDVTITLESSAVDTYLIAREGEAKSGTALHENDDYQGSTSKSQVEATLAAGTYTVEATTYYAEKTGSFTLTVSGLGGSSGN